MAIPVRAQSVGATSTTTGPSKHERLFATQLAAEKQEAMTPQDIYASERGDYLEAKHRQSVFGEQPPTSYTPPKPLNPEVDLWDDIKASPAAALRGFTQGMAVTADLIPTVANALGEYAIDAYDVLSGQGDLPAADLDSVIRPWALSNAADKTLGTVDSYEVGAVSEIASDVAEAIPMIVSMGAGMARYGATTMMKQGAVNPLFANYSLKFSQSLGLDVAAVTLGETVEEIAESAGAEENGALAITANIVTSILGGWKLSQTKLMGANDDALKAAADSKGVEIASKNVNGESTLPKGMAGAGVKIADAATGPVKAVKAIGSATKSAAIGTAEGALNVAAKLPFSKNVFREFKENNGSFTNYLKEQSLLDTTNKGYMKIVMDRAGNNVKKEYSQNLELAAHLGLKLDTYQLTGLEEFAGFSKAVAKLNPAKTLETLKHNIDMVEDFLTQKGLGYNESSNNALQLALKKHHGNTEDAIGLLKKKLVEERDVFIKETRRTLDPAKLGEDFLAEFTKHERNLKDLVGRGFEKAIPADTRINTKFFNNHVLTELTNLKTDGIIPANIALPKVVRDMMEGTAEQVMESGVRVTPKVTAREIHESVVQLKKARKALIKGDPAYNIKEAQLINVIESMEDTLAQHLTPTQFKAYNRAKTEYHDIVGAKYNQNEVKKFTLKNQFNQLKSNGQELIEELLNTAGASESRIDAINKLLTLSHDDMMQMAHRIDDVDYKNIDDIAAAQDVMHLKIKDYIVQDYMGKLLMNPNRNPVEMMEEYMGQHGRVIHSVLNEPMDLNKMAREVDLATQNLQIRVETEISDVLNIGAKGERDLGDYITNSLIKSKTEVKRFVDLLEHPEKLKKLGLSAKTIRDTVAGKLVETFVTHDRAGTMTGSTLFNVIKKRGDNIEAILGKERMDHLRTFERGFGLADMVKKKDVQGADVDLDRTALNKGAMKMLKGSVSTHLMVKHGFVSKTYAYSMRAIQILGGLQNNGYRKFMTKMMTDPKFFQDAVEMAADVKTHDDIVRARLVLEHHFGIPTAALTNQDGDEQSRSLMDAGITLENSVFKDFEQEDIEPTVEQTEKDLGLIPATEPSTQDQPTSAPIENSDSGVNPESLKQQAPAAGITNVPTIAPSDPTASIATRKTQGEINQKGSPVGKL